MSATLARAGQLDAIAQLPPRAAYQWLCAAGDFGHDVDDAIGELCEHSTLRYDDTGAEMAAAHFELAVAYADGTAGLPSDLELATEHLARAFAHHDLNSINAEANEGFTLAALSPSTRAFVETYVAEGLRYDRVVAHVSGLRALREGGAPESMIEAEKGAVRDAVEALLAD